MFETCMEMRSRFSDYLDGRCEREELKSVRFHLGLCAACRQDLERMQAVQAELRGLARRRVPPELGLRLRIRMSHELHRNLLGRLWVRFENAFQPLLLPASGGVLAAIILFVLIMGSQFVPRPTSPDIPLGIYTPPRVRTLAPLNFDAGDQSVVLLTQIDAAGRVMSYRVLSGQPSPQLSHDLDRIIYFSLFDPATAFGKPTGGQVVLSLRRITVRG